MPNKIAKEMAILCGYDNPETNTGHGKRKFHISKIANSGLGPSTTIAISRHKNVQTVTRYHKPNQQDTDRAIMAMNPSLDHSHHDDIDMAMFDRTPSPSNSDGNSNYNSIASINGIGQLGQLTQFSPESNSSKRSPALPATINFSNL